MRQIFLCGLGPDPDPEPGPGPGPNPDPDPPVDEPPPGGGGGVVVPFVPCDKGHVECGCDEVGAYVPAAGIVAPVVNLVGGDPLRGRSPDGRYELTVSSALPATLVVTRVGTGQTLLTITGVPNGGWGFAPGGDAFVVNYLFGGSHHVALYHLGSTARNTPIWTSILATGSSALGFSPHGYYFVYAALRSATEAQLTVVNASTTTGDVPYDTIYQLGTPPGGSGSFDIAGWGFSPDCYDRTFLFARVLPGAVSSELNLVNLPRGQRVLDRTFPLGDGHWEFSPCGDLLGTAFNALAGGQTEVALHRTKDGTLVSGSAQLFPTAPMLVRFESSLENHSARIGATASVLAPNTADDSCAAPRLARSIRPAVARPAAVVPAPVIVPVPSTGLHYYAIYDWATGLYTRRGKAGSSGIGHKARARQPHTARPAPG